MKIKVYEYKNCSTCLKALKFLAAKKIAYESLPIVDHPPTLSELKRMLGYLKAEGGSLKNLFNTSGVQYRELKVADQLKNGLSETDALKMLSINGKLIKRPFMIGDGFGLVGFKVDEWAKAISK